MKLNQKPCIKMKVLYSRKRSKTLSEVKSLENISNNLQSFLDISRVQKQALLSHKLQDHEYEKLPESIELVKFVSHRPRMSR